MADEVLFLLGHLGEGEPGSVWLKDRIVTESAISLWLAGYPSQNFPPGEEGAIVAAHQAYHADETGFSAIRREIGRAHV